MGFNQKRRHGLDLISSLSDDIILHILSFLSMKAAGRTGVLSQRWRDLWTKLVDLNFDASKVWRHYEALEMEQHRYVEWVNEVIDRHSAPLINTFKVHFLLDSRHTADIDKWVKFAIQKGVRNLELNVSGYGRHLYTPNHLLLSRSLGFAGLKTQLESLTLVGVNISGLSLQFILSDCLNLQHLSVRYSNNISSLKIAGSPLKLKHLEMFCCYKLKKLEISAKNLSNLLCWGGKMDVVYHNVPSLVEACFGGPYGSHLIRNFQHLSGFSSQLEKLSLLLIEMNSLPVGFPTFTNIKQLKLGVVFKDGDSLLFLISYLEACPLLQNFTVELKWTERLYLGPAPQTEREARKKAKFSHRTLKIVEMVGFFGGSSDVELALYLTRCALVLEKIVFDPRNPATTGFLYSDPEMLRQARSRAAQLLERLPPGLDVVIN